VFTVSPKRGQVPPPKESELESELESESESERIPGVFFLILILILVLILCSFFGAIINISPINSSSDQRSPNVSASLLHGAGFLEAVDPKDHNGERRYS
jgi:hypothetical protein